MEYATPIADEFRAIDGQNHSIYRTIIFDSWLLWKHALPPSPAAHAELNELRTQGIGCLAEQLHQVHQTMPGYRMLNDTPFRFRRWWDPCDPDWEHGRRCLFTINGFTSNDIVRRLAASELRAIERGYEWVEAILPRSALRQVDGIGLNSPALRGPTP